MRTMTILAGLIGLAFHSFSQNQCLERSFGEGIGFTDGYDVLATSDLGALLIGARGMQDLENAQDPWLIKVDDQFEEIWDVQLDFAQEGAWDFAITAIEVSNGYLILGNYNDPNTFFSNSSLLLIDFDGNIIWSKILSSPNEEIIYSAISKQVNTGNFVLFGVRGNQFSMRAFDASGEELWEQSYPGNAPFATQWMGDLLETSSGHFLATLSSNQQTALIKTDAAGNSLWTKELEGVAGMRIQETNEGNFVLLTSEYSDGNLIADDYVITLNSNGEILSNISIPDDWVHSVRDLVIDANGDVYLSGMNTIPLEGVVIKMDAAGDSIWTKSFRPKPTSDFVGISFDGVDLSEAYLYVNGAAWIPLTANFKTPAYQYGVRIPVGSSAPSQTTQVKSPKELQISPNPASTWTHIQLPKELSGTIELRIYNSAGQLLRKEKRNAENGHLLRGQLPAGLYYLQLQQKANIWRSRIVFN